MILITGGTGTVGTELARSIGRNVRIFSRNEDAQIRMKANFPDFEYYTGDIRSWDECYKSLSGCDTVYHLAAMKHVGRCEEQPEEAIKTNIIGTMNLITAAKVVGIKKFVYLSTDKCVNPVSIYGKTKQLAEDIVMNAKKETRMNIIVVRSGNILGSSNSIVPILKYQINNGNVLTITNGQMTRFFITVPELIKALRDIIYCDDVYIPPMRSFKLADLALAIKNKYGNARTQMIETKPLKAEKIHEEYQDEKGNIYSSKDFVTTDYEAYL